MDMLFAAQAPRMMTLMNTFRIVHFCISLCRNIPHRIAQVKCVVLPANLSDVVTLTLAFAVTAAVFMVNLM